ncbi:hypothetical protein D5F01_LYC25174 [Larimichthys crocea]|uniref:Uncharacterized protein n=1 Tax=Larimichthys crocea TaxID=215358 RepID=A0A6G0HCV4_LARCR|nr:hypothetical protein D5F01_LYC25174 [Larimichthys crocea]
MDHLRPSSLHPSLGRAGSREPPSGWRSQGPDHSHTTHARTHRQTQRKQEGGPDMDHLRPSSLHPSLGRAGSREPPSGWRSQGPDHSHTTHARTHRQTQGGPDMDHLRPSSLHPSLGRAGSREPPSGWRSQGPDHSHTTHARTHRQTQGSPDMGHLRPSSLHPSLGRAWLQRASLRLEAQQPAPIAGQSLAPESLPPAGGHRGLITVTLHTHAHTGRRREPDMGHLRPSSLHPSLGRAWLQRASLRLEVTGA